MTGGEEPTREIRITDLANPVLNDVQRMAIDWGDSHPTDLTVDAVCEAAMARTRRRR
jgi:hypothetical protein